MAEDSRNMTMRRRRKFQLTPSLPQPVKFLGRKKHTYVSHPVTNQFLILCVLMEVLSHANVEKKKKNA